MTTQAELAMYEAVRVELLRQRDRLGGTAELAKRLVNPETGRAYSKRQVVRFLNGEICVSQVSMTSAAVRAFPGAREIYARFVSSAAC